MKFTVLLVLCIFMSHFSVHAQFGMPKVISPSPEAAKLARYVETPISYYTGKPQITIPLYEITSGELRVPITMSYDAAGVKVEDPSTSLGVGWTLNAGGVVTRAIRGATDAPHINTNQNNGLPIRGTPVQADWENIVNLGASQFASIEADIFYYNFNGHTGSFYIKGNRALLRKYDDVKVDFITNTTYGNITAILITTKDGVKNYFEQGYSKIGTSDVTEWYLSKIVDVNNTHQINIEYSTLGNNYIVPPRNSKFYWFTTTLTTPHLIYNTPANMYTTSNTGPVVSKISTSENNRILFKTKNLLYEEAVGGTHTALDEMTVYNSSNSQVKRFKFGSNNIKTIKPYSTVLPGYPAVNYDYSVNYRLYMDSLSELDDKYGRVTHKFEYFGRGTQNRDSLPSQLSCAQDMGGYYNGRDTNQTILPTFKGILNPFMIEPGYAGGCVDLRFPYEEVTVPGANRDPDFGSMIMGTLKSVHYPTGGKTEYKYEQMLNPATNEPFWGFRIQSIKGFDAGNTVAKEKHYLYSQGTLGHSIPPFLTYTRHSPDLGVTTMFPACTAYSSDANYQTFKTAVEISVGDKEDLGLFEGPLVGYGHVEELEQGNGKTIFEYQNDDGYTQTLSHAFRDINAGYHSQTLQMGEFWPMGPYPNSSWKRGILLKQSKFSDNAPYDPLYKIQYHYSFLVTDTIRAIKVLPVFSDGYYFFYEYNYFSTHSRLDSISELNNNVLTKTTYEYNNSIFKQKSKEIEIQSDGSKNIKVFKYPYDYGSQPYLTMVSNYQIEPIIIAESYRNLTDFLSSTKTDYSFWSGGAPTGSYTNQVYPLLVSSKKAGMTDHEPRVQYDGYDEKGNVLAVRKAGGPSISYIWGYDKAYPIAEVKGAPVNEVYHVNFEETTDYPTLGVVKDGSVYHTGRYSGKISNSSSGEVTYHSNTWLQIQLSGAKKFRYSGWVYSDGPSADLVLFMKQTGETGYYTKVDGVSTPVTGSWVFVQGETEVPANITSLNLRIDNNGAANGGQNVWFDDLRIYPVDAQMSTYTYDPLVGMTSSSDAKDMATYYEYDAFGRLGMIKDKDRNILKSFCYNYLGQQTDCFTGLPQPGGQTGTQMVYARISSGATNYQTSGSYGDQTTYGYTSMSIQFYSDAACTTPVTLSSGMTVSVARNWDWYDEFGSGSSGDVADHQVPAGVSSYPLGSMLTSEERQYLTGYGEWIYSSTLYYFNMTSHTGSNYTPL